MYNIKTNFHRIHINRDIFSIRFQLALQKHVNGHINSTENGKDSTVRRASDPPVPKKLRVNGKRLRYRRQPFSGMFPICYVSKEGCWILNGVSLLI